MPGTNQCVLVSGVALNYDFGFALLEENSIRENDLAALKLVIHSEQVRHQPLEVHALSLVHPIDDEGSPLSILIAPSEGGINNCCASLFLHNCFANWALASQRSRALGRSCANKALCALSLILSL